MIEQVAGSSKMIWQSFNDAISQSIKQIIPPDNGGMENGESLLVTESTAEEFNTYFTNIGLSQAKMLPDHNLPPYYITFILIFLLCVTLISIKYLIV